MLKRRWLVLSVIVVLAIPCVIAVAYGWFKSQAIAEMARRSLPGYTNNGIKHAFAAAETYALARSVGLSSELAAQVVYNLGEANEWVEYYGRRLNRRDPTQEIYKDLYNNAVGVAVAVWLEQHGPVSSSAERLKLIGQITELGIVLHTPKDPRIPLFPDGVNTQASNLSLALTLFNSNQTVIKESVMKSLRG